MIILASSVILGFGLRILRKTTNHENDTLIIKTLAIALFLTYAIRLFSSNVLDNVFNLLLVDIDTPINAYDTWLFGVSMSVFMVILQWFTVLSVVLVVLTPFFKAKNIKIITAFFAPVIAILNLVFFNQNLIMFIGEVNYTSYRSIQFVIELILMISLSFNYLLDYLKLNGLPKIKDLGKSLIVFMTASIALVPLTFFYNLFGNY